MMSKKRPDFKTFKERALKDAAFRAAYEELQPEFELIRQFIRARQKAHRPLQKGTFWVHLE
jgi:hypothetical protein